MKELKVLLAGLLMLGMMSSLPMTAEAKGHSSNKSFSKKFFNKVKMVMANTEELNVTDSQYKKIEELKWDTKKAYLKKKHEIKMLEVDAKELLYKDKIDVDAIEEIVEKKYEAKEEKSMLFVNAFAQLKDILTKEQKDQIRTFYYKKSDCGWGSCCMGSKGSKGSMKGSMK